MNFESSHSNEQQAAEKIILELLATQIATENEPIHFEQNPSLWNIQLDGYSAEPLIFVEVWARIGKSAGSHSDKVVSDFCKMLVADQLAGKKARKIFAVICPEAIKFLKGKSWHRMFADLNNIEIMVVDVPEALKLQILAAQERQGSKMAKKLQQKL